jgi:hypothetical protein
MSKRQQIRERLRRRRELAKARKQQADAEQSGLPKLAETPERSKQAVASDKKEIDRQRQREIDALEREDRKSVV